MSKSLFDVLIENVSNFSMLELIKLKDAIDTCLGGNDLKIQTLRILKESGKLCAIKYVKEKTGWGLREAKDFCDSLD